MEGVLWQVVEWVLKKGNKRHLDGMSGRVKGIYERNEQSRDAKYFEDMKKK